MKNSLKNVTIMLILAIAASACEKEPFPYGQCLTECPNFCNMENIHKTIPLVNEFLAKLPNNISREKTFESLVEWLNSFSCKIDAEILYREILVGPGPWPRRPVMSSVGFSVKDDKIIREIELDFAVIEQNGNLTVTHLKIAGYIYTKQDIIHVSTRYTKLNDVFDFINSKGLEVYEIQSGCYISSMPVDSANLKLITNSLKAKPYTRDHWVVGHFNWYMPGITFFVRLYDMHRKDYQADWIKTMNDYKMVKYEFPNSPETTIDGITYGPGDLIVFRIPEETGKQWETTFRKYDFVRWSSMGYSRYTIR